jgi:hypothetical protein
MAGASLDPEAHRFKHRLLNRLGDDRAQGALSRMAAKTPSAPDADRVRTCPSSWMNIGRTCQDEGIAVEHFRRIIFFEDKVRPTTAAAARTFPWPIVPRPSYS